MFLKVTRISNDVIVLVDYRLEKSGGRSKSNCQSGVWCITRCLDKITFFCLKPDIRRLYLNIVMFLGWINIIP